MKMKNWKIRIGTALAAGIAGLVFAQGSLTPPGAPGATMKTLEQVEPRTPISSAPYMISQPGSYYLTTNLTSTGHGVVIRASDVTLDLTGFTLSGDRGTLDYGVFLDGATNSTIRNVTVCNGIVRNFGSGVQAEYIQDSRFERLMIATNLYNGVFLYGQFGQCNGNTLADCTISGNGSRGIVLYGTDGGQCNGNTITDCKISGNGNYGIYLYGYVGQCNGNTLADCTISGNDASGIFLDGRSAGQCNGNTLADCTISGNTYAGIYLYGYLGQCSGNRVEGNHITGQTGSPSYGINCGTTAGNLIFRNTCAGQTDNFFMDPNDTYGPIVTSSGPLPTTGAGAHPLANFSR